MTEEEKIHIAAEKLYEAYGADADCRLYEDISWLKQPEGFFFWSEVWELLEKWKFDGKPA